MCEFLFVTIRAFDGRRRRRFVMRAALAASGLGMAAFRIRHDVPFQKHENPNSVRAVVNNGFLWISCPGIP